MRERRIEKRGKRKKTQTLQEREIRNQYKGKGQTKERHMVSRDLAKFVEMSPLTMRTITKTMKVHKTTISHAYYFLNQNDAFHIHILA